MKNKLMTLLPTLASFVFTVAVVSGGIASAWYLHQEKEPEALAKFLNK